MVARWRRASLLAGLLLLLLALAPAPAACNAGGEGIAVLGEPVTWLHFPKAGSTWLFVVLSRACPALNWSDPVVCGLVAAWLAKLNSPERLRAFAEHGKGGRACGPTALSRLLVPRGTHAPLRLPPPPPPAPPPPPPRSVVAVVRSPAWRLASGFLHGLHSCGRMQDRYGVSTDEPATQWTKQRLGALWAAPGDRARAMFEEYADCVEGCQANMLLGAGCAQQQQQPQTQQTQQQQQTQQRPPGGGRPPGVGRAEWGARAAGALRASVAFVGLQERWNESVQLFAALYGGAYPPQAYANSRPGHFRGYEAQLVALALARGDPADEAVYAAAAAWFDGARACAGLPAGAKAGAGGGGGAGAGERGRACAALGITLRPPPAAAAPIAPAARPVPPLRGEG